MGIFREFFKTLFCGTKVEFFEKKHTNLDTLDEVLKSHVDSKKSILYAAVFCPSAHNFCFLCTVVRQDLFDLWNGWVERRTRTKKAQTRTRDHLCASKVHHDVVGSKTIWHWEIHHCLCEHFVCLFVFISLFLGLECVVTKIFKKMQTFYCLALHFENFNIAEKLIFVASKLWLDNFGTMPSIVVSLTTIKNVHTVSWIFSGVQQVLSMQKCELFFEVLTIPLYFYLKRSKFDIFVHFLLSGEENFYLGLVSKVVKSLFTSIKLLKTTFSVKLNFLKRRLISSPANKKSPFVVFKLSKSDHRIQNVAFLPWEVLKLRRLRFFSYKTVRNVSK